MAERSRLRRALAAASLLALAAANAGAVRARRQPANWPVLAPPTAADRILVVAPHIDDEAIAAGGYMQAAVAAGAQVSVAYLTAGDCNRTSAEILDFTVRPRGIDYLREGTLRFGEALVAMGRLGVPRDRIFLLGYPDRGLLPMLESPGRVVRSPGTGRTAVPYVNAMSPGAEYRLANLLADLGRVLRSVQPTIILLPVPFDAHPDHSAGGRITLRALADSPGKTPTPRVLGYLVHARRFPAPFLSAPAHPLNPPRAFAGEAWTIFPLTREQEIKKKRVLQAYRSQREDPYLFLLTDAFVRRNELFVRLRDRAAAMVPQWRRNDSGS
jgi:LmbE family N-acetylglucosaminyl deacetylase